MSFDYEQSIWGKGEISFSAKEPSFFRLKKSLEALKDLPEGSEVLEVGCGAGQFIRAIKKIRPDLACCGCDISETALKSAKQESGEVSYALSQEKKLPYKDGFARAVLIFDVLEHVQDALAILKEINRVLEKGGMFYCFVPCEGDVLSLWNWLKKLGVEDLTRKHAGHINKFSRSSLKKEIKKNGFEIEKIRYGEHFFGQLLGILSFLLMEKSFRKNGGKQINNERYFEDFQQSAPRIFADLRKAVNFSVNLESALCQFLPSPNVHIVARKK